jgi:hypothetical protein
MKRPRGVANRLSKIAPNVIATRSLDEGVQILELARNAQRLFAQQEPRQKRRLLNFILSNCSWGDGEIVATFRQPFDLLAETTTLAAQSAVGNKANAAKSEIWLGDLTTNFRSAVSARGYSNIAMPTTQTAISNG